VYQSDDGGANWQDISAGLPPELLVMRILPGKDGEIFLGAQNGVFRYNVHLTFYFAVTQMEPDSEILYLLQIKSYPRREESPL
jgi:hypothetical protein